MNKLIFLLMILNSVIFAQSDKEKFLEANSFYNKGQFQKAIEVYQSIDKKNNHLWLNLGNSYYKLGKMADAKVSYLRAKKLAKLPDLENIDYNISQLNQKLNIKDEKTRLELFMEFIEKYLSFTSFFALQLLFLILWFLTNLFFNRLIKNKKYFLLTILIFINFIFLLCIMIKSFQVNRKIGIVSSDCAVLAGPDKNYHQVGSLNLADKVTILKEHNDWLKVSKNNLTGWIPLKYDSVLVV